MVDNHSGINIYYSADSDVSKNQVRLNAYGIRLSNCDYSKFTYNVLKENSNYGLHIDTLSTNNSISNNRFEENRETGECQAYDDGSGNLWYNEYKRVGNYWSHGYNSKEYPIDGIAESVDRYPIIGQVIPTDENDNPNNGESFRISSSLSVVLLCIAIISIMRLKTKRTRASN